MKRMIQFQTLKRKKLLWKNPEKWCDTLKKRMIVNHQH